MDHELGSVLSDCRKATGSTKGVGQQLVAHLCGPGTDVVVTGQVTESGRADKILVFHFKRKKQYKKIYGHRQPFTQVRITEIAFDGQRFAAPELPQPKKKAAPAPEESESGAAEEKAAPKAKAAAHKKSAAKKAAPKKAAKKPAPKKGGSAKKKK